MSIQFSTLIKKIDEFYSDKINSEDFAVYLKKNIERKTYLPISNKYNIIKKVYNFVKDITNEKDYVIKTEYIKGLLIFFNYTDMKYKEEEITEENFDKICKSNIYSYVVSYAENDIKVIYHMFENYMFYEYVKSIFESFSASEIDYSGIKELNNLLTNREGIELMDFYFKRK